MLLQIKVPKQHSDFMRVLWYDKGNLNLEPSQYRLKLHTFGAVSSPSIANFALKRDAADAEASFSAAAVETLKTCVYVDDIMRSLSTEETAVNVLKDVRSIAASAGFNVVDIVSNSRLVLNSVPKSILRKDYREINLQHDKNDTLPGGRVLGVWWNLEKDCFAFDIEIPRGDITRRRLLSVIGSIFDPMGLVTPVIVPARSIFQQTCALKLGWDENLPDNLLQQWNKWTSTIGDLKNFTVPRCLKENLSDPTHSELHLYCDGSLVAYGAVAYLRSLGAAGKITTVLIASKTRQTPASGNVVRTIPRIELNAAKLAVVLSNQIKRELSISIVAEYYWSDSQTVLKYLRSDSARFQRFVENRVSFIREHTDIQDWHYVPSSFNIADMASRGIYADALLSRREWVNGPVSLRQVSVRYFEEPPLVGPALELKVKATRVVDAASNPTSKMLESTSDWRKLVIRVMRVKLVMVN